MRKKTMEERLSKHLLEQANLRGNEYAWPLDAIPDVIEAIRAAGLLNIGGQLQFRPDGGTCEAYAIEVDTYKSVPENIGWDRRGQLTAEVALHDFKELPSKWDFLQEGRLWASKHPDLFPLGDESIKSTMCFVWYCADRNEL